MTYMSSLSVCLVSSEYLVYLHLRRAFVAIEDSVQKTLNQRSAQLKACKQEGEAIAIALVFVWHGIKCGFSSLSGLEQFEPKLPSGARNGY